MAPRLSGASGPRRRASRASRRSPSRGAPPRANARTSSGNAKTLKQPSPTTTSMLPPASGRDRQSAQTARAPPGSPSLGNTDSIMGSERSAATSDVPAGQSIVASSGVTPSSSARGALFACASLHARASRSAISTSSRHRPQRRGGGGSTAWHGWATDPSAGSPRRGRSSSSMEASRRTIAVLRRPHQKRGFTTMITRITRGTTIIRTSQAPSPLPRLAASISSASLSSGVVRSTRTERS
jgi:hypothetical protein